MKRLFILQLVLTVSLVILMAAAVGGGYFYGFFQRADNFLYDLHFKWRGDREPSGQITLVLMDQESAEQLKRQQGSWSRPHLARAIENLNAAGAAVIGIDLIFSSPSPDPKEDARLAAAIEAGGNVVLARVSASHGREIAALEQFQAAMVGDGFIDVPLDQDNILRKIRFFHARRLPDGSLELLPSFSLELARVYRNIEYALDFTNTDSFTLGAGEAGALTLPYPELLINYGGDYRAFTAISFADAVNNRFSPADVKGKLVLIGSSLVFEKDFFSTPYTRFRQTPQALAGKFSNVEKGVLGDKDLGTACHAWAADTILTGTFISKRPQQEILLWTLIAGLAGVVFYFPVTGLFGSAAILLAGLLAFGGIGHHLFISRLIWLETAPLMAVWILQFVMGAALQKSVQRKKSLMITDLFGKYLAPDVVRELLKDDLRGRLEGSHRDITVLFSDLRGFTSLSEKLGPTGTSRLLNAYFDVMIPMVFEHRGTLDKLIGDAIMAFFGAPLEMDDHPGEAAACALAMLAAIDTLRRKAIPGAAELELGIGLNTGQAIVGNLGSKEFMDYTVIGDTVNLASRLESINKLYGTHIIVSQFTAGQLQNRFQLRKLDTIRVTGRDKPVSVYELMGFKNSCSPEMKTAADLYESGLTHYCRQNWPRAMEDFHKALELNPTDQPCRLMIRRTEAFSTKSPPEGWDGVTVFDYKS